MILLAFATPPRAAPPPPAAQETPLDAFKSNIAAIQTRDRAAYLAHYLHTPALARVGPDGLREGYEGFARGATGPWPDTLVATHLRIVPLRSEEHTSELQSRLHLVCRLLLEKKKNYNQNHHSLI